MALSCKPIWVCSAQYDARVHAEQQRAAHWEGSTVGGDSQRPPLTPMCCSTDQVKGVLTLQGDALSQAVSSSGPASVEELGRGEAPDFLSCPPATWVTL